MNDKDIIGGNKLIAEFMGLTQHGINNIWVFGGKRFITLNYHLQWNWLMTVVEKIEDMSYDFNITGTHVIVVNSENGYEYDDMANSKIESVWLAVVEFIKFHNSQSNK